MHIYIEQKGLYVKSLMIKKARKKHTNKEHHALWMHDNLAYQYDPKALTLQLGKYV